MYIHPGSWAQMLSLSSSCLCLPVYPVASTWASMAAAGTQTYTHTRVLGHTHISARTHAHPHTIKASGTKPQTPSQPCICPWVPWPSRGHCTDIHMFKWVSSVARPDLQPHQEPVPKPHRLPTHRLGPPGPSVANLQTSSIRPKIRAALGPAFQPSVLFPSTP